MRKITYKTLILMLFFIFIAANVVVAKSPVKVLPHKLPKNYFQNDRNENQKIISPGLVLGTVASQKATIQIDPNEVALKIKEKKEYLGEQKKRMVGIHIAAPKISFENWERLATNDGLRSWRISFVSQGATFLRLHFKNYVVSKTEKLIAYNEPIRSNATIVEPPKGDKSSSFWGPLVQGERTHLEFVTDSDFPPGYIIDRMSIGFKKLSGETKESWCYLDPNCYSQWSGIKSAIGQMIFSSGWAEYVCTGSLIMDSAHTFSSWFLTANHCINKQTEAASLVVTWNFETTSCNGNVSGFWGLPKSNGAQLKFGNKYYDETLLLLNQPPPADTTYLGWTTEALIVNEEIAVIHHPDGAYKRISFGYMTDNFGPYWNVRYYESATEGGSSGSPLFNEDKLVVGTLTSGLSACNALWGKDNYGKFNGAWSAGMSDFLNNGSPPPDDDDDDNTGNDDDDNDDDEWISEETEEFVENGGDGEGEESWLCG